MHTAFGQPRLLSQLAHTLRGVVTQTLENLAAVVPKSHVGRFSEASLNSWWNAVLQRTRPTPHCPALSGYPNFFAPVTLPPEGLCARIAPLLTAERIVRDCSRARLSQGE